MSNDLQFQIANSWSAVSSQQFEQICRDALVSVGFTNVVLRGRHTERDRGRDIEADYLRTLPDGHSTVVERWFVECKHKRSPISVQDLVDKVGWALAEKIDCMAVMSPTQLTVDALDYLHQHEASKGLKFCLWTGDKLSALIARCPSVINTHFPKLASKFLAESRSRERIELAKKLLASLDLTDAETGAQKYRLLEEVLRRCIENEDIKYIDFKRADTSSEIIYILAATAKGLASEQEVLGALTELLERAPSDERSWALARHMRTAAPVAEQTGTKALLVGPRMSGKTALIYGLQVHCLSDPRFRFPEETFGSFPDWFAKEAFKRTAATSHFQRYRMEIQGKTVFRKRAKTLWLFDSPGEMMDHLPRFDLRSGDLILVTFNSAWLGSEMSESFNQIEQNNNVLSWAKAHKSRVIILLTKTDCIDSQLRDTYIAKLQHQYGYPVISTSAAQQTGLDVMADTLVREVWSR